MPVVSRVLAEKSDVDFAAAQATAPPFLVEQIEGGRRLRRLCRR